MFNAMYPTAGFSSNPYSLFFPTSSFGRAKSMSQLQNPGVNGLANQEESSLSEAPPSFLFRSDFGDITGKNWSYLTNEVARLHRYVWGGLTVFRSLYLLITMTPPGGGSSA